jgi:hypothetical protein
MWGMGIDQRGGSIAEEKRDGWRRTCVRGLVQLCNERGKEDRSVFGTRPYYSTVYIAPFKAVPRVAYRPRYQIAWLMMSPDIA